MGIRGLRSYINRHHKRYEFMKLLEPFLSADCVLIIEAPNLVHTFHEHMGLDSLCGGQFEEFYRGLIDFFSSLKAYPRLRVIVLLIEVTGMDKLEVLEERKQHMLTRWMKVTDLAEHCSFAPTCAWEVFYEAVRACGVETLCYDHEADDFMTALAVHFVQQGRHAFILSNDTDLYMTVGVTGLISIDFIHWSPSSHTRPVLEKSKFFSLPDFLKVNRWQPWMIPFMAMLLGNDLTPPALTTALEPVKTEYTSEGRGHMVTKIINYLSRYTCTELDTLASFTSILKCEFRHKFNKAYTQNRNRYLSPVDNIDRSDIPIPQLARMKGLYPGVCEQSLLRVACLWNNRVRLISNAHFNAEDYRWPFAASLASKEIRSYCHGIIFSAVAGAQPSFITEMSRRSDQIVNEQMEVLYRVGEWSMPSLAHVQELARGDKIQLYYRIMHCSSCHVIFSDTEHINYDVSIILSTLYYWFHRISFRENRYSFISLPSRLSPTKREKLFKILIVSALTIYFQRQLALPALRLPDLKSVTRHEYYHSVAEWLKILQDTNLLLTTLDLPTVSARRSYDGCHLFLMITESAYSASVSAILSSFMRDALDNVFQALLNTCSEQK